ARILESLGELRRGGRLAAAVDPDNEDDPRPLTVATEPEITGERRDERLADRAERFRDGLQFAGREQIAQLRHERIHQRDGQVGAKKRLLKGIEPRGRERQLAATEKAGEESTAGLR